MKKLTAIIMALVMAMSMTVAAYAVDGPEGEGNGVITNATPNQDSVVKVAINEYFEWTVPAEIVLTQADSYNEYTGSGSVEFTNVLLLANHGIKVTISDIDTIDGMDYEMKIGDEDPATGAFVTIENFAGSIEASASLTATHAITGDASDGIVFTAQSVENA